jgi:hypothetical protein
MNYELAIELNDAGFPKIRIGQYWSHGLGVHSDTRDDAPCHCNEDKFPNLEELIEAVERDGWFGFSLEHNHINDEWDAWIIENVGHKSLVEATVLHSGSTPTEAVARLWLVLNKKV